MDKQGILKKNTLKIYKKSPKSFLWFLHFSSIFLVCFFIDIFLTIMSFN